jgi:hypothetical protein
MNSSDTWNEVLSIDSLLIGLKDGKTPKELLLGLARVAAYRIGLAYSGSERAELRFGELIGIVDEEDIELDPELRISIEEGSLRFGELSKALSRERESLHSDLRIWFERARADRKVRLEEGYRNMPRKEKELPQTYEEFRSLGGHQVYRTMSPAVREDKRKIRIDKILDNARQWKEQGGSLREFNRMNNISRFDQTTLPGIKDEVRRVWYEDTP